MNDHFPAAIGKLHVQTIGTSLGCHHGTLPEAQNIEIETPLSRSPPPVERAREAALLPDATWLRATYIALERCEIAI